MITSLLDEPRPIVKPWASRYDVPLMHLDAGTIVAIISGALAAVASLIAGSFWWSHRGERKELSYDFSSARLTLTDTHPFAKSVQLLVNDMPAVDVSIVTIDVRNSGTKEILPTDFIIERELCFVLPESLILTADVSSKRPPDLGVEVYFDYVHNPSGLFVRPLLLNPSDAFTIYLLVSAFSHKVEVTGRIAGVKHIPRRSRGDKLFRRVVLLACLYLLAFWTSALSIIISLHWHWLSLVCVGGANSALTIVIIYFLINARSRLRI